MSSYSFGPYDSTESHDRMVREEIKGYFKVIDLAEDKFQFSPDGIKLARLPEARPRVAAFRKAKRFFGFGEGIVTKALECYAELFSNFLRDEDVDPRPIFRSHVSIDAAIEMHLIELYAYKVTLNECQLFDEIDADEYEVLLEDTLLQASHIADMTARAKAQHDQFLAEVRYRNAH